MDAMSSRAAASLEAIASGLIANQRGADRHVFVGGGGGGSGAAVFVLGVGAEVFVDGGGAEGGCGSGGRGVLGAGVDPTGGSVVVVCVCVGSGGSGVVVVGGIGGIVP